MIWFFEAAHSIMRDYDRENDHDGPRHFEKGLSLMVGKLIRLVAETRGPDAAKQLARLVISEGNGHLCETPVPPPDRDAIVEMCAKVVEDYADEAFFGKRSTTGHRLHKAAERIRALSSATEKE